MHETVSRRSHAGKDAAFTVLLIVHCPISLHADTFDHHVVDCWGHLMPLFLSRFLKTASMRPLEDRKTWCHR